MLGHSMDGFECKKEDFHMWVRYFDKGVNELRGKEIDCTELQGKTKGLLNISMRLPIMAVFYTSAFQPMFGCIYAVITKKRSN